MPSRKHTTPTQLDLSFDPAEEWRPITDYEGLYAVSNLGRVMNSRPVSHSPAPLGSQRRGGRIMSPHPDKDGYLKIHLCKDGKAKVLSVHRIVLIAFLGAHPEGYVCNHIDGNPGNNRLDNLEWCTQKANIHHAMQRGTHPKGESNGHAALADAQVRKIRQLVASGASKTVIARQFGVHYKTVWKIIHRRTWKHIE